MIFDVSSLFIIETDALLIDLLYAHLEYNENKNW